MKIIHTSDWHLGKFVHEYSMIDDQRYALEGLINIVEEENVDVVIISGNLYDRLAPSHEAVELLDWTLNSLIVKNGVKVFIIRGNHDSLEQVGFGSKILEKQGLFLASGIDEIYKKIPLSIKDEKINFYLVPYRTVGDFRELIKDENIKSQKDIIKRTLSKIKFDQIDENQTNILIYHGYVSNNKEAKTFKEAELEVLEIERTLETEGHEIIHKSEFSDFNYVALGHLHNNLEIDERIRYSGSLMKYSFEEKDKFINIIETEKGIIKNIEKRKIAQKKEFKKIILKDTDILKEEFEKTDDYVSLEIIGETELVKMVKIIKDNFENVMEIKNADLKEKSIIRKEDLEKTPLQIFKEYYSMYNDDEELEGEKLEIIKIALDKALRGEVE